MSAEMISLDLYLSTKMRKKFDDQEKVNAATKGKIELISSDVETLCENYFSLQQKIDRLCSVEKKNPELAL